MKYRVYDPFAGDLEIEGESVEDAVMLAYEDIPEDERPTYVRHGDTEIPVPGGTCAPV